MFVIGPYFSRRTANKWEKIHLIGKNISNNIDELYIHLREEFTPCQRFSEKDIENLREALLTFENPSRRFQESPIDVLVLNGSKLYIKWPPKIEGVTEK